MPGLAATRMGPSVAQPVIRGLGGDLVLMLEDGIAVGSRRALYVRRASERPDREPRQLNVNYRVVF